MDKFTVEAPDGDSSSTSSSSYSSSGSASAARPSSPSPATTVFSDADTVAEIRRQIALTLREKARLEQEIFKGDVAHVARIAKLKEEKKQALEAKRKAADKENSKNNEEKHSNNNDGDDDDEDDGMWKPPPHAVPICGDVRKIDFDKLCKSQIKARGRLFDIITMDPPWQLASANPTRGVALGCVPHIYAPELRRSQ